MLVMLVVCGGCFVDVDFANTRFSCAKDGSCPGGYDCVEGTCVADGTAEADGGGGGAVDGSAGGGDASAVDDGDASIQVAQCGVVEVEIAIGETHTGTTVGGGAELGAGCTESAGAEVVHRLVLGDADVPVTLTATSDLDGTGYDAVLYVRRACDDAETELGCDDAGSNGDTVTFDAAEAGVYYVIVDSHDGGSGSYELVVSEP